MLRETARRLWGKNPSPEAFSLWQCLEETAEGVGVAEEEGRAVWRAVAVYLSGRLQTTPDQKSPRKRGTPGRAPHPPALSAACRVGLVESQR